MTETASPARLVADFGNVRLAAVEAEARELAAETTRLNDENVFDMIGPSIHETGAQMPPLLGPLLLALGLVSSSDNAALRSFDGEPRVAVLVGIAAYPAASGLPPLKYSAEDVDRLRLEFVRQGYQVVALKDQQATRAAVRQALRNAADLMQPRKGTLVFFFSGHGYTIQGANVLAAFDSTAAIIFDEN